MLTTLIRVNGRESFGAEEHLEVLEEMCFDNIAPPTRLSFGIQDFDPKVAKSVNRENPPEMLEKLLTPAIREKFPSINFDIICGFPNQTLDPFRQTIDHVSRFSPQKFLE